MVKGVFEEKSPLLNSEVIGLLRGIFVGLLCSFGGKMDLFSFILFCPEKAKNRLFKRFFVVEEGGFEPPKSLTADLQSAPFGRSGTLPYCRTAQSKPFRHGAGERTRTPDLLITNRDCRYNKEPQSAPPHHFQPFQFERKLTTYTKFTQVLPPLLIHKWSISGQNNWSA